MATINYTGNVSRGGKSSVYTVVYYSTYMYIHFRDRDGNRAKYKYYKSVVGSTTFEVMIILAKMGKGLNGYLHRKRIAGRPV